MVAMLICNITVATGRAQTFDSATEDRLDGLYAELAEPGRNNWQQIEDEIARIWSRSGSESMDLLLRRGMSALEDGNFPAAIEHFSALTETAPSFAEGWNARATAYYLQGNFELSLSDIEYVLSLNPRHFNALYGFAAILEQMGQLPLALDALREVQHLNPNRPNIDVGIERIEREMGASDL